MNSVTPSRCENAASSRDRSGASLRDSIPAGWVGAAGRGRSAGSSRTCGAPASSSRHQASCSASTSPCSHSRCHAAKSAYWIGSSGSGEGAPADSAR